MFRGQWIRTLARSWRRLAWAGLAIAFLVAAARYPSAREAAAPLRGYRAARSIALRELYPVFAMILLVGALAFRRARLHTIPIVYALLALYSAFVGIPFSLLDEAGHFGYAAWFLEHLRLPLTTMQLPLMPLKQLQRELGPLSNLPAAPFPFYEAVQPPLYYWLLAMAGAAVRGAHSIAVTFFAMRLASVGLVAGGLCFLIRAYRGAVLRRGLVPDDLLFGCALATLALSPQFLFVTSALTNDALAILLGSAMLDALVRLPPRASLGRRHLAVLVVLGAALWLTKFTSLWLVALPAGILLVAGGRGLAAAYTLGVAAIVSPLHMFNYRHYHALSGAAAHLAFVRPIVNPSGARLTAGFLAHTNPYWFFIDLPNAWAHDLWLDLSLSLVGLSVAAGGLLCAGRAVRLFAASRARGEPPAADGCLALLVALGVLCPLLTITALGASSRVPMTGARYGYLALFCSALALFEVWRTFLQERVRLQVAATLLCATLAASAYSLGSLAPS